MVANVHAVRIAQTPATNAPYMGAYMAAAWPFSVVHVAQNYNPSAISFPYEGQFGKCMCQSSCRIDTCRNGRLGLYCTRGFCPFDGHCGNGLGQSPSIRLMRNHGSKTLAVVAVEPIEKGVILGEYLGELSLVSGNAKKRKKNEGYRLHFKANSLWGTKRVCITTASSLGA